VVYKQVIGQKHHAAKPQEVRWVADGLGNTQRLRIEGKPGQANPFDAPYFEIDGGNETITSGKPVHASKGDSSWTYNITLYEGQTVVASYDPTIEIKDDP